MNQEPTGVESAIRQRIFCLLESAEPTPVAKGVRLIIGLVILANVIAVIAESHESFYLLHASSLEVFNIVSVIRLHH